jgi:hypothetical protein
MAVTTSFGVPVDGGTGTLMPKLQYRFRVTFNNLGGSNEGPLVTRNIVSVTRPGLTHDDVTVDVYNSKIRLAGKHTWDDVSLVIRDDINSDVIRLLGNQMSRQVNHATQSSSRAGTNYKFGMTIDMLDGSNDDAGNTTVIDSWNLVGCFIPTIAYGDLNYATSEVVQVTVTIRYDNASHDLDGVEGADVFASGPATGSAAENTAT